MLNTTLTLYDSLRGIDGRKGQRKMMEEGALALERAVTTGRKGSLLIEAPTGTGKSYALLLLALAAYLRYGFRTVLSTQTHVLQEQYVGKDIPGMRALLGSAVPLKWKSSLVKGRSGYICPKKLQGALSMANGGDIVMKVGDGLTVIDRFQMRPLFDQVRSSLDDVTLPEDSPLLSLISSDRSYCLYDACPYYRKNCAYFRALRRNSPLIVTNHSLLTTLISLPDDTSVNESKSKLGVLSGDLYLIDEAHHLMGYRASGRIVKQVSHPDVRRLADCPMPLSLSNDYERHQKVRQSFVLAWRRAVEELGEANGEGAKRQFSAMEGALVQWGKANLELPGRARRFSEGELARARHILQETVGMARSAEDPESGLDLSCTSESICLSTRRENCFSLDARKKLERSRLDLFTSGTVLVGGTSDVFEAETGVTLTQEPVAVPTPFSYKGITVWIPRNIPSPKENERFYEESVLRAFCAHFIPEYVKADLGGVLVLCSSLKRMRLVASDLKKVVKENLVLMQGDMPKKQLTRSFLHGRSPVLVGSASFREGFDAPGNRLTWVIIDRLPFANPRDANMKMRTERLHRWGVIDDTFRHQMNLMKIHLIQSVGRLIRKEDDWGTVTVLDSRVWNESWGLDSCFPVERSKWVSTIPDVDLWVRELKRKKTDREMTSAPSCGSSEKYVCC